MRVKNEGVSNCANCHKSDWSRRFPLPESDPDRAQREVQETRRAQMDAVLSRMLQPEKEPAEVKPLEHGAPTAAQRLDPGEAELVRAVREEASSESRRAFFTSWGTRLPYVPHSRLRARRLITVAAVVAASVIAIGLGRSATQTTAETATHPAPAVTVTMTAMATATATETVTASPAEQAKEHPVEPVEQSEPTEQPSPVRTETAPRSTFSDSPGRHDGSDYDNLSPEGQEAHDTLNCADVPGHKKGSCNEPNRKCNLDGAQVTSSGGIRLTCQMADDARLRWLP
ncbi:hypothetical protein [Streptomyces sp. NPDC093094]|uniref:hypothetical protein n=1 Tax=Streptomyces sp. NPDC093094 TaxID=3366026 RepID=UPI003814FB58